MDQAQLFVPPARNPLGINGKSVHAQKGKSVGQKERYIVLDQLQRHIQTLLRPQWHATCSCQRSLQGGSVGIKRKTDGSGARFEGLITCGEIRVCPPCAAKVMEERRLEVILARNRQLEEGGEMLLMTLTFPHEHGALPLATTMDLFGQARQIFERSRTYKRVLGTLKNPGRYGRIGSINSLEFTHGPHGWHPHIHGLLLVEPGLLDDGKAIEELNSAWVEAVIKVGLGDRSKRNDMLEHAFDLRGGDYAADYILKYGREPQLQQWGIIDEATRSLAKRGSRHGHLTPFALARASLEGDEEAGALFVEFVNSTKGRRAMTWSPGLKKHFGIADATDEELARAPMAEEEDVCRVNAEDWQVVLERNARGELRYWAAKEGEPGVRAFLEELRSRPRSHQGHFMSSVSYLRRNEEIDQVMHQGAYRIVAA